MPTTRAAMVLNTVAHRADLLSMAISGKRASPSWEMALASSAAKGTRPLVYSVTKMICGPQPGIIPMSAPTITAARPV